jgi:hypothetical protein
MRDASLIPAHNEERSIAEVLARIELVAIAWGASRSGAERGLLKAPVASAIPARRRDLRDA